MTWEAKPTVAPNSGATLRNPLGAATQLGSDTFQVLPKMILWKYFEIKRINSKCHWCYVRSKDKESTSKFSCFDY